MNAPLRGPGWCGLFFGRGLSVVARAHAAEPHVSQPRAPFGARALTLVCQVLETKEPQP